MGTDCGSAHDYEHKQNIAHENSRMLKAA